jgi:hypothetical protein
MNTNSHQSLHDVHKDTWFEIIKVCELDSLYSMYWVNKSFQQRIKNEKLLPLWICLVMEPDMCEDSRQNLESSTKDFLSQYKFLPEAKHYKLEFLIHEEFLYPFNNSQLSPMINMLEINVNNIHSDSYRLILEKVHHFRNIKMLSLKNAKISRNFPELCSKNHSLRCFNLSYSMLFSSIDFSTCSFVEFSLDNMHYKNGTSIKMPRCLKKCDLSCCQMKIRLNSNYIIKFQMSHCKKLNTL